MARELHDEIVRQLGEIGFSGRIAYHLNCEPLLDPRLVDFIGEARRACPKATVQVTTNGLVLNEDLGRSLFDAGLDCLDINNYTDQGAWRPNILQFMQAVARDAPAPGAIDVKTVVRDHPEKTIELFLRDINATLLNRGGSNPSLTPLLRPLHTTCLYPFMHIAIGTAGKVGLCCTDFYFDEEMGDLTQTRVVDVWRGERYREARLLHLGGRRARIALCRRCDSVGYRYTDLEGAPRFLRRLHSRIGYQG